MKDELIIRNAHLKDLPQIIEFITNSVKKQGMDTVVFPIESAVDEACTNIIKYAYNGDHGFIKISVSRQKNIAVITINDKGKQFDPNSIAMPDVHSDLDRRKIGGLGIYLIKKLMDEIIYHFDPKTGNTLVLKKRFVD